MKNSLKQLLHTPVKAALFFLLMAAASLLLIFGSVMLVQSLQRIDAAEEQFITIGTVEQIPKSVSVETITWNKGIGRAYSYPVKKYSKVISESALLFQGAEYILPPENRPYYFTCLNNYVSSFQTSEESSIYVIEFSPVENCAASEPVNVEVRNILLNKETGYDRGRRESVGVKPVLEVGDIIPFYDYSVEKPQPLEKGKTYISVISWANLMEKSAGSSYIAMPPPYSTQYEISEGEFLSSYPSRHGLEVTPIEYAAFDYPLTNPECSFAEEVTEEFYETGGRGQDWLEWIDMHEIYDNWFFVCPTNSLDLLPSFHHKEIILSKGRRITEEEFMNGAPVCMVAEDFAKRNLLELGDKISLPFYFSLYGYLPDRGHMYVPINTPFSAYYLGYSPLDADMNPYEPFWEAEYEIVGTYEPLSPNTLLCGTTEIARDMFIIPMKSVQASDENNIAHYGPMNALTTSFQIPNGTIQKFDADLREAVPEVSQLNITYDDNGYEEVMGSLRSARLTAVLLFLVGLVSTVAIVILLLFFFIVKQKKRTAIERSLGMSKKQCRISLIAGILVLTIVAAMVGSLGGALLLNSMDSNADITETTEFDTSYSLWAQNRPMEVELDESDAIVTAALYIVIPVLLTLFVLLLSLVLVNQNLKVEPLLLLSTKTE